MIFFDVGANNGGSSIYIAERDASTKVYAFEPTPYMISVIESKVAHLSNYTLVKAAVSDYNGRATFNISGNLDWGCSSLLELSEKAHTEWYGRTDMNVTERVEVDVIRLDSFIEQHNIPVIDFLHIDTQGSDLNVLKGLGKYISIVIQGEMEAANKPNILYKGQNTKEECVEFLESNGFVITSITPNDPAHNEVNIYFRRV